MVLAPSTGPTSKLTVVFKDVVEVRHTGGHKLWMRFRDGASGAVDLSKALAFDGVFGPHALPECVSASGTQARRAQRSLAGDERGFARRSAGVARITSSATAA